MIFVFVHANYPGQFKNVAGVLAADKSNTVIFITNKKDANKEIIPGINIINYELHRNANESTHYYVRSIEDGVIQAQGVVRVLASLLEKGIYPDYVFTHAGNGLGLFIKDILPNTKHIGYFEWYFLKSTSENLFSEFDIDKQLMVRVRNMIILQELCSCDCALAPTEWQKNQFPIELREKINVIFDGIDTSFFYPNPRYERKEISIENRDTHERFEIVAEDIVLSYATRGMEPLRGFPEFMESSKNLLEAIPNLKVIIAGADRVAYSYEAETHQGSWKDKFVEDFSLQKYIERKRMIFTGLLTYQDYRQLLWRTDLHCYFTHPYVTSWSLFEAIACGASLAVNYNDATNYIGKYSTINWVDIKDNRLLTEQLKKALKTKRLTAEINHGFTLTESLKSYEDILNSSIWNRGEG